LESIEDLIKLHESARLDSLNLIVSENRMSERAKAPLGSDISQRYAADFYSGTEPARRITEYATNLAQDVFGAQYANLSPISGNVSLLAVVFALSGVNDPVGRIPPFFPGGGYPLDYGVFDRKSLPLPFSDENWQVDLESAIPLLRKVKPPLVVLGSSIVTYPMPVREISDVVHSYGGLVAYDGSHSLGLIAGGQYQDPLREGADLLLGSTHKTFPGPQGGLILTNDEDIHERVEILSNFRPLNGPTLICNPHLARIASTGIVLEETAWRDYAQQVVVNARSIADALQGGGIPLRGVSAENFPELTYCHQVLMDFPLSDSRRLRDHLGQHRINVDGFLRLGVSEITRLGFSAEECAELGHLISVLLKNENKVPEDTDRRIQELIESHREVVL
jgi:glycine hydroxymethyltransferase